MRLFPLLVVSLSLSAMLGGCASTSGHTFLKPPTFEDPRLARYLDQLLAQHEIFVNELDEFRQRGVNPVCSLDADESWALSGTWLNRHSSSPQLAILEVSATLMEGGCRDGKAVAPYIAATRNHYVMRNPDMPELSSTTDQSGWVKGVPNQESPKGATIILRETNTTTPAFTVGERRIEESTERRYDHRIESSDLTLRVTITFSPFSGNQTYTTEVRRQRSPQRVEVWEYQGNKLSRHWTEVNESLHGLMTTYNSSVYAGIESHNNTQTCYRDNEEVPLPDCGVRKVEEKTNDNFGAALLGGLAAAALGHNSGMSEAAAVDFGASMARDIQDQTVSTRSFEATGFQAANQGRATAEVYQQHLSNRASSTNYPTSTAQAAPTVTAQPSVANAGASAAADSYHVDNGNGQAQKLPVSKVQRTHYAGVYANTHHDAAVADFRYSLNADGSVQLLTRACANCTHELDGQRMNQDWKEVYQGVEWAPMLNEMGQPLIRNVEDMYGNNHAARVLVVMLADGRTKTLNHYMDANGPALSGPYGVPRYKQ